MTSLPTQSLKSLGWGAVVLPSFLIAAPAVSALPNADSYFHVTETTTGCENVRALHALNAQGQLLKADAQWINAVRTGGRCVTISPRSQWMFLWLENDVAMMSYAGTTGRPGSYYIRVDQLVDQNNRHPGEQLGAPQAASGSPPAAAADTKGIATPQALAVPAVPAAGSPQSILGLPTAPRADIAPLPVTETIAAPDRDTELQYIGAAAAAIALIALAIAGVAHFRPSSGERRSNGASPHDGASGHASAPPREDWGMPDALTELRPDQRRLEAECADSLRGAGWGIEPQDVPNGAAYVATRGGSSVSVHFIASAGPVGVDAIQRLVDLDEILGAQAVAVVSNAPFTRAAQQVASARAIWTLRPDQLAAFDLTRSVQGIVAKPQGAS